MIRDYFQYNTYGLLNFATALFDFTLGLLVLLHNRRSPQLKSFFYFSFTTTVWLFGYGMMNSVENPADAFLWLRFAFCGVPLIPATIYLFSLRLKSGRTPNSVFSHAGFVLAAVFVIAALLCTDTICSMRPTPWGRTNLFSNGAFGLVYFWSLMVYYAVYFGAAYYNFVSSYRSAAAPQTRAQFRAIIIAFSIGYVGVFDFAATKGIDLYPFGYIAMTLLIATIAYGVVRNQVLDISMALKRISLIVLIYVFLVGFSVPLMFSILRNLLYGSANTNAWYFVFFSALFGLIFSTGPFIFAYLERHTFWLKKHVTTGLTHELKSPISSIRGALSFLQDRLQAPNTKPEQIADYVAMIDKNTTRLENYVKDLLNVAKIQDGVATLNESDEDLVQLVTEIVAQNRLPRKDGHSSITVNLPDRIVIRLDKEKIQQTVSNILNNAIKFSKNGNVNLTVKTHDNQVLVSISDEGCGLNSEELSRIFDRFYQGKQNSKGSGIGLTIAKAWVEAHGGKIWAESDGVGKGTTVTFTLPVI